MSNWAKEIENDLDWRWSELASIKIQIVKADKGSVRYEALLRALVVLLYAHYEGFCKFSWDLYLDSLEKQRLKRKDCDDRIVRLSLSKKFKELKGDLSPQGVWDFFTTHFPLLMDDHLEFKVRLETQSNLWPNLLKANSQEVGLSCAMADYHGSLLKALVRRRNDIAHGRRELIRDLNEYEKYEKAAFETMYELGLSVVDCLEGQVYLK
jgi:MAE_28990/MAE_18760-like HEPN